MYSYLRKLFPLLWISGLVVLADQITKIWIRGVLQPHEVFAPWPALEDFFFLVHSQNTGMFLGTFRGLGVIFSFLAIAVSLAILIIYPRVPREEWALRLGMSLQLGGVIGNLLDRIFVGYVTDFVAIGRLPIFNLADISIYLGLAILLVSWSNWPSSKKPHPETVKKDPQI